MSLIENLKGGGVKPATVPTAPGIAKKLEAAKAELAQIEAEHDTAALDAVIDAPGASARYADLQKRLASVRDNVAKLESAHRAAVARDDAAIRQQRASLQKAQLNAVRSHLAARDKAGERFEVAIVEAAAAYRELLLRSEKAQASCPIGMDWPGGSLCERDTIIRAVQHAMHKASAEPGDLPHDMGGQGGHALPGTALPGMDYQHRPTDIPALADRVKQASAHVIATLTGKAPE